MPTRTPRLRRPWWALLALAAAVACGPAAPTGPGLAALTITIDPNPAGFTPTPLTVTATDASGAPLTSFGGTVTLHLDDGTVSPASITLSSGAATVDVTLGATIGVPLELTARHGATEGSATLELAAIPRVPGVGAASAADALPFLGLRPREGDHAFGAPDLPFLPLSVTTLTVVVRPSTTIGDLNDLLDRHGAGVVAFDPGAPGLHGPMLALRFPTNDPATMHATLQAVQAEAIVDIAIREHAAHRANAVPRPNGNEPAAWTWEVQDPIPFVLDANWGLERIRVPQLWNLNARADTVPAVGPAGFDPRSVGILDTGFTDHVDLVHLMLCDLHARPRSTDLDDNDHGVRVAGIIGALYDNGVGIDGVSPFARLYVQRLNLDKSTAWNLAEMFRPGCPLTPRVVNVSIGYDWLTGVGTNPNVDAAAQTMANDGGRIVRDRLENRRSQGVPVPLFVVTAGNESASPKLGNVIVEARWGSAFSNAALAQGAADVLVVEALDRGPSGAVVRRPSSNLGGHLSAPGGDVWSTHSNRDLTSLMPATTYGVDSGTSFAAPFVTGVASFLFSLDPELTNAHVVQTLTSSAVPVAGAAPMVDAFAAALALDGVRGYDRVRRALLDVDDGSPDGNTRQDPFTQVPAAGDPGDFGPLGDGRIDMRDFRRFRDALLQVANAPGTLLDGPADHPKRDLNLDGRVDTPGKENVFPRTDFNGDGTLDAADLEVLKGLWEDPDVFPHELDELLDSGDLHVDATGALADALVGAIEIEWRDELDRGVRIVEIDRDHPTRIVTLPAGAYEAVIRLLDQGGLLLEERSEPLDLAPGADRTLVVEGTGRRGSVLAAGDRHALALLADRTVVAWGDAILGNGTGTGSATPVAVAGLTDVVSVAAGGAFSLALKADGTVWSWGRGFSGALGHGDTDDRTVPTLVAGLDDIVAISAQRVHALAVTADGRVFEWGFQYAHAGDPGVRTVPTLVPDLTNAVAVKAGEFALVVLADGRVVGWGRNDFMQLGDGSTLSSATPVPALGIFDAIAVTGGATHGHALLEDGTVAGWGLDILAGLGGVGGVVAPGPVTGTDVVVRAISSYQAHTLALTDGGLVLAWGNSNCGELGDGLGLEGVTFPLLIATVDNVVHVAAGFDFSLFALRDGSVMAVGCNRNGQLGDGTTTDRALPVRVLGITDVARP
jgi:alpha-tubulin suppressor-like RCC1 family protein